MVMKVAPQYANLAPDLIKSYSPPEDRINTWHTVKRGHTESLETIAKQYLIPIERLVEFNFPGSVTGGRINPSIVNWYLFNHVRTHCLEITHNGANYMFSGGEKIAIPFLGQVEIGEITFLAPTSTRFKIRQHMSLDVSIKVVGAGFSIYQVWDPQAGLTSFYTFKGGVVSASITPGWLSATSRGPWNNMAVNKPMAANQFTGAARFTTGGAGNDTWNYINFMQLPPGTQTIPNPLALTTGFTFGAGAGTSVGTMTLELVGTSDGLLPFKGP